MKDVGREPGNWVDGWWLEMKGVGKESDKWRVGGKK